MMKIVVDAGHGGKDSGAVNYAVGVLEKDLNLRIAMALQGWFMSAGHTVLMTRTSDFFVDLHERAAIANREKADAFISIHCNAATNTTAKGFEIWTSSGKTEADSLATAIGRVIQTNIPRLLSRYDFSDGDLDKEGNLAVLRLTRCPAVLIEVGFISEDSEAIWLLDPNTIQNLTLSIFLGVSMWEKG
jgi:N-acetylmuramoyl-L-alanine amidase